MQLPKQKGVLMFKRAAILIGSLCFAFLLFSAQAPKVQDIKVGLEYVVPEDVGWSSQKLEEAKAFAEKINSAAVSDLLKSRSGVYHEAAAESEDMVETRPTRGSHPHDTFFYYNNWDFNALGTIFEKVTGAKIFEAFKREIAEPIGMEDFSLDDCQYSYEGNKSKHPAYNFRMTARDMARFGLLYLRKGNWNGRQIIPEDWIEKSTAAYSNVNEELGLGYGYMWNVVKPGVGFSNIIFNGKGGFYHTGVGIHTLSVLPEHKVVYIYRYDTDGEFQDPGEATIQLVSMILNARLSK